MRVALVFLLLVLSVEGASAANMIGCRPEPEPAVDSIATFQALENDAAKARLTSIAADIKIYQQNVKGYRDCIVKAIETVETQAAAKGEKPDAKTLETLYNYHDATVTREEQIVGEYVGLRQSLCGRGLADYCEQGGQN